jgi:hypothetical protein
MAAVSWGYRPDPQPFALAGGKMCKGKLTPHLFHYMKIVPKMKKVLASGQGRF